jgi:hypothetical protein
MNKKHEGPNFPEEKKEQEESGQEAVEESQDPELEEAPELESGPGDIISLEALDALIESASRMPTASALSEQELNELIEERARRSNDLAEIEDLARAREYRVRDFVDPLSGLSPDDYDRLAKEKLFAPNRAERFKKVDELIEDLEGKEHLTVEAKDHLHQLLVVRRIERERISEEIETRQAKINQKRERIMGKVADHYAKRADHLEEVIKEIESNPLVRERLEALNEEEKRRIEEEKKKADAERIKAEEERREQDIDDVEYAVNSMLARHEKAFTRLESLLFGGQAEKDKTIDIREWARDNPVEALQRIFKAILSEEGTSQLKEPREIVPWRQESDVHYTRALLFLREIRSRIGAYADGAKEADAQSLRALQDRLEKTIDENRILFDLIGSEWITDREDNSKKKGPFWAAFDERKENDLTGRTKELKELQLKKERQREEQEEERKKFEEGAKEILGRGGFRVQVPIYDHSHGRVKVIGTTPGVVRIEKKKSQKGKEFLEVVELYEVPENGLRINSASPLDMRSFPEWVREGALRTEKFGSMLRKIQAGREAIVERRRKADLLKAEEGRRKLAEFEKRRVAASRERKGRGNPGKGKGKGKGK